MSKDANVIAGPTRRIVLQGALVGLVGVDLALSVGAAAAAAEESQWPKDAFQQKNEGDALKALYSKTAEASDKVKLEAPEIAENGAVVPISVSTTLPNVTSISILVPANPFTLAASYKIPDGTLPSVANRLKMAKTSNVIAIVESDGKLFTASRDVKVTVGGCGG